jgi:hypothetical protein
VTLISDHLFYLVAVPAVLLSGISKEASGAPTVKGTL